MRRAALALLALLLLPAAAAAQSGCSYITNGAVLTAAQWNFCFQGKNDALGYVPVNRSGDTMQGLLTTSASAAGHAGLSLAPGVAPTVPNDGDLWTTTAGLFVQISGATYGPLGGSSSSFASLTVSKGFFLTGASYQTIAGDQNDFDPTGAADFTRLYVNGGATDRSITGLARGADGRLVEVVNNGTTNFVTVQAQNTSSLAANRFQTEGAILLPPNAAVAFRYDGTALRWRTIGREGSPGTVTFTNAAAPATPAAGRTAVYVDSTSKVLSAKNDAGTVSITAVPSTAPANQFATALSAAGVVSYAQPTIGNLANINADNLVGNPTGAPAAPAQVPLVNCANSLTYSTSTHLFGCNSGAGTGSVTSVAAGNGLATTVTAAPPGSAITATGTLSGAHVLNAQTGTTYALADGDRAKLVTFNNAAATAVSIIQAGTASSFQNGWFAYLRNLGAGTVTITPTTSTIDGSSSYALRRGDFIFLASDGTNYQVFSSRQCCTHLNQVFTASGTYTPAAGVYFARAQVWGGGGGSSGGGTTFPGAGGGGGEYCEGIAPVVPGTGVSITVGLGGIAGPVGTGGGSGSGSSFGSTGIAANPGAGAPSGAGVGGGGGGGGGCTLTGAFQVQGGNGGQNNYVGGGGTFAAGLGGGSYGTPFANPSNPGITPGGGGAGSAGFNILGLVGANGRVVVWD